jgi:hypothetical protein
MTDKLTSHERRRFAALIDRTDDAEAEVYCMGGDEAAHGELIFAGLRGAVQALLPGRANTAQVDAALDRAVAGYLAVMRRRARRPNPRGL